MKIKLIYLFLLAFVFIILVFGVVNAQSIDSNVFINEILPDPTGTDTGKEWIELYNPTSTKLNLTGWKIKNISAAGSLRTIELTEASIDSKQFLVLADSNSVISSDIYYLPSGAINLFNTNSKLELYNSEDILIDTLHYTSSEENKSWERKGPLCEDVVKNTVNSLGFENQNYDQTCWPINPISYINSQPTSYMIDNPANSSTSNEQSLNTTDFDKLIITEVYASPNTGEKEWIEIFNPSNSTINLADFKLKDINSSDEFEKEYVLNGNILPNSYLVFETSIISLNNSGDRIALFYKDILIEEIKYPTISKGESYSRKFIEGIYLDEWFKTFKVTRSISNSLDALEVVSISSLISNQNKDKVIIQGCITLVKTVMPSNFGYIQDNTASIKVKFLDDAILNIDDCIQVTGKLVRTTKELYFSVESLEFKTLSYINSPTLLSINQNYKILEGKKVLFNNIKVLRKYSYSLLLENDLKMKYPEDFDSSDYANSDSLNIAGVIIKLSGVYYIYPYKIEKSDSVLGTSTNISNEVPASYSFMPSVSLKAQNLNLNQGLVVYTWWIYLLVWIGANSTFFYKYLLHKFMLDNLDTLRLKYLNAKRPSYFGKEIFHRNFSKEISKKQSDV